MELQSIITLLKEEVLPTMGCTEPGAVALAAAYASEKIEGEIKRIRVRVNPNIYKNGVAVGIPGTGKTGLEIAAALGAIKKHSERQLQVLAGVTKEELLEGEQILAHGLVLLEVDKNKNNLFVEAQVETEQGYAKAILADRHTNLVHLEKNEKVIFRKKENDFSAQIDYRSVLKREDTTVAQIVQTVEKLPYEEIKFLLTGVEMNLEAAQIGIEKN